MAWRTALCWRSNARPTRPNNRLEQLHGHGRRFPAADAETRNAALAAGFLERRYERRQDAGTAGTGGVAERGRAAVDVDLLMRDTDVAHRDHGDAGEGFVDLEQVDVADAPTSFLQHLVDRGDGSGGELRRLLRMGCVRDHARNRLGAEL